MKARNLLSGAAYGPERLKDIYKAFDEAWRAIEPVVENTPLAHEAARLKLANMILSVAQSDGPASSGKK
jgi:hypothetical protein